MLRLESLKDESKYALNRSAGYYNRCDLSSAMYEITPIPERSMIGAFTVNAYWMHIECRHSIIDTRIVREYERNGVLLVVTAHSGYPWKTSLYFKCDNPETMLAICKEMCASEKNEKGLLNERDLQESLDKGLYLDVELNDAKKCMMILDNHTAIDDEALSSIKRFFKNCSHLYLSTSRQFFTNNNKEIEAFLNKQNSWRSPVSAKAIQVEVVTTFADPVSTDISAPETAVKSLETFKSSVSFWKQKEVDSKKAKIEFLRVGVRL